MNYEWDNDKNLRNMRERGIDFALVEDFEWQNASIGEDTRRNYGERRFRAMGPIDGRLHVLIYTIREETLRIISLRRANKREEAIYEKTQKT